MSMQDPIADMLTCIRNAQAVKEVSVSIPSSSIKLAILDVLKEEGYVDGYELLAGEKSKNRVKVLLKYYQGKGVIGKIARVSKPGLRIYRRSSCLPKVLSGLGIAIISTPMGVMTEKMARAKKVGGEVLCVVE